jgi:hypothetical protein
MYIVTLAILLPFQMLPLTQRVRDPRMIIMEMGQHLPLIVIGDMRLTETSFTFTENHLVLITVFSSTIQLILKYINVAIVI